MPLELNRGDSVVVVGSWVVVVSASVVVVDVDVDVVVVDDDVGPTSAASFTAARFVPCPHAATTNNEQTATACRNRLPPTTHRLSSGVSHNECDALLSNRLQCDDADIRARLTRCVDSKARSS